MVANTKVEPIENGIRSKLYEGFPYLNMQFSKEVEFVHVPDWYLDVEYPEEQKRGYDFSEDLFAPGFFEFEATEGEVIIFSASTKEEKTSGLKNKFARNVSGKTPRDSYVNCLRNAAQQFIEKRGGTTHIIAGYPWFGTRGRDNFISLPGLALARHKLALFIDVLDTQINNMKDGLFPNFVEPNKLSFNSADTSLWFFWAVQQYMKMGGEDGWERYGSSAKTILDKYRRRDIV